ncbi:hypothetical protein [Leeuwenhoekiella sp. NPDC079379]|uniref:hypothetical protein n=1 Tax=Leeuwenhoekiella sp. NPDC079379 TaxID=3364122 RepID=UPI0037CC4D5A
MKNIYVILCSIFLLSCSNEELTPSPKDNFKIEQSAALRATLEELRFKAENEKSSNESKMAEEEELCFQFVYPISLSYSDGSIIVVSDFNNLLEIILNESLEKHINGIAFPFDVKVSDNGSISTISDEADFKALINNCGYEVVDYTQLKQISGACFTISYPVSLRINEASMLFLTEEELSNYIISNYKTIVSINLEYPLSVSLIASGQTEILNDDYEVIYLIRESCGIE